MTTTDKPQKLCTNREMANGRQDGTIGKVMTKNANFRFSRKYMNPPIRPLPMISSSTERPTNKPSQTLRLISEGVPCRSPRYLPAHRTINFWGPRSGASKSPDHNINFLDGVRSGASRSPDHHYRLVHGEPPPRLVAPSSLHRICAWSETARVIAKVVRSAGIVTWRLRCDTMGARSLQVAVKRDGCVVPARVGKNMEIETRITGL